MLIRLLFWFLLFYFLLRFIIRVVIPVVTATRNVRSKMNDINQNINDFQSAGHSSSAPEEASRPQTKNSPAKEDYIDFEEIK